MCFSNGEDTLAKLMNEGILLGRISWEGRMQRGPLRRMSKGERTSDNVLREIKVKDKMCD